MTISSATNKSGPYTENGVTDTFAYEFKIEDETHVKVVRAASGVETVLTLTTDYTVTGVGDDGGGNVVINTPVSGSTLTLVLNVPFTQELDLENQGAYFAESVEAALDLAAQRDKQLQEKIDRAVVVPVSADVADLDTLVAGILALEPIAADITTVAGISGNVTTVAGIDSEVTTVAGISANVVTVAGISADVTAVAADAADIGAVATNIANVNTVAGIAANVTAVAGNASNINAVAGNATNINAVAGNATNINAVAANATNINAVAANETNIDTVADNIADVVSAADNMAAIIAAPTEAAAAATSADEAAASAASVNPETLVKNTAQSLTVEQQAQARANISAALKGHIYGLALSNNATDATNDIDIATGEAASTETNPALMVLSSALTKRLDAAWAVGTNQGGLDTGTVTNTTYYVWLIRRSDTGVVDVLFSASSSSPTMPTNYDQKVLIGSFARTSGTNTAPRSYGEGDVTPWVQYTPTFSNFGTVAGASIWSRRVGDCLHIRGRFTSGTAVAGEARMTFGHKGTNANVSSSTSKISAIQLAGPMALSLASAVSPYVLVEQNVGSLAFSYQDASSPGLTKKNGDAFGSGTVLSFIAEIPVEGW